MFFFFFYDDDIHTLCVVHTGTVRTFYLRFFLSLGLVLVEGEVEFSALFGRGKESLLKRSKGSISKSKKQEWKMWLFFLLLWCSPRVGGD